MFKEAKRRALFDAEMIPAVTAAGFPYEKYLSITEQA
jgi:hypothetical protein